MPSETTSNAKVDASEESRSRIDDEPSGAMDERTRVALLTAGVIAAVAIVWAIGLGVLDRAYTPATSTPYSTSPTARVERRPVLFAICPRRGDAHRAGEDAGTVGVAVPIASIDPGGRLRSPLQRVDADELPGAELTAFVSTYCHDGAHLRVLYGGAYAGSLRFFGAPDLGDALPEMRVGYEGAVPIDIVESAADDLLGISDPRFGAISSGARAMQASHREAVDHMAREAVRERFAHWQFESTDLARVRVADLDRSGASEVLATMTVRLRMDARRETTVALFLIGEPTSSGSPEPFHLAYVAARETSAENDGFAFIDQVDLTDAQFDEVVVRSDEGDLARYLVLQRGSEGWYERVASPPVTVR